MDGPQVKTVMGGSSEPVNMAASIAAQAALDAGKPLEEALTIGVEAAKDAPPPPNDGDERELKRRYLVAICNLGHGSCGILSTSELVDSACLVSGSRFIPSFETWRAELGE